MPPDDDTNYMLIALELLETCGKSFTPDDVTELWLSRLVKGETFTAERVAYRNFLAGYRPPDSAIRENPFREWIGAQIRGDVFGYACPCDPEAAAGLAFRDACISHIKNGIYGEMLASAMVAAAFGAETAEEAVLLGLAEIPQKSRLHESVSSIVQKYRSGGPEQECFDDIARRWDEREYHVKIHTISNAEIVAASLLY
ncbi:MAG: ADP-ribosylglycohydrolase family protein, partial [Clostridia bacterium]|nr:ADP-ribosylglycohydrolase family protein [Clostridia bacterium]